MISSTQVTGENAILSLENVQGLEAKFTIFQGLEVCLSFLFTIASGGTAWYLHWAFGLVTLWVGLGSILMARMRRLYALTATGKICLAEEVPYSVCLQTFRAFGEAKGALYTPRPQTVPQPLETRLGSH